jgi:hypothetical protein
VLFVQEGYIKMEKGYVENGFIVDLAHSKKTSDVIYELSKILDMPEAKNKSICLKLGDMNLTTQELVSIKALIETMDSKIEFISTGSDITTASAKEVGIDISKLGTVLPALDITATEEKNETVNAELENALDKIFGDTDFDKEETTSETKNTEISNDTEKNNTNDSEENVIEGNVEVVTFEEPESLEEIREHNRETEKLPTLYIHRTLRSEQSISP